MAKASHEPWPAWALACEQCAGSRAALDTLLSGRELCLPGRGSAGRPGALENSDDSATEVGGLWRMLPDECDAEIYAAENAHWRQAAMVERPLRGVGVLRPELPSHGRFEYSPIVGRPDFSWPGGRRLAVYIAVCIEHFAFGESGLGLSYSPGIPHPNTYNWAWREYGNRVGGWRLLEMLQQNGVPPTVLLNTACYAHCPELLDGYRAAGSEFVGHGRTNSVSPNDLSERDEREMIRQVFDEMSQLEGMAPGGWMSPGANPSRVTEDLLAETGFTYTLDWPMDDQPVWMRTQGGPLLSIPYPHEVNDVPMIALHHGTASGFADMMTDNLDEMIDQSRNQPLVFGITVHAFIMGQPYRLRQFRRAVEHLVALPEVWLTTPGRIASHYASVVPSAAALSAGEGDE